VWDMKVAVTATDDSLDAQIDPRFGRCQYFLIVDTETMEFEAIENTAVNEVSGAGIQAAQTIASKGAQVVITGSVGPNAYQVLSLAKIKIVSSVYGTVRNAVERFKRGEFKEGLAPNPVGGRMRGMGAGRGMGRTMGVGQETGGNIRGEFPAGFRRPFALGEPTSKEEEISMLEHQMEILKQQLEQIKERLDRLKGSTPH